MLVRVRANQLWMAWIFNSIYIHPYVCNHCALFAHICLIRVAIHGVLFIPPFPINMFHQMTRYYARMLLVDATRLPHRFGFTVPTRGWETGGRMSWGDWMYTVPRRTAPSRQLYLFIRSRASHLYKYVSKCNNKSNLNSENVCTYSAPRSFM